MGLVSHKKRHHNYAVVIDAGSSGSRSQIYSWPDPRSQTSAVQPHNTVNSTQSGLSTSSNQRDKYSDQSDQSSFSISSIPNITQESSWSKKTTPGISSFAGKSENIWNQHLKQLVKHAESIVPPEKIHQTPLFVLATAGMRLLSAQDQQDILSTTCKVLRENTRFYLPECTTHVNVIDGETEGLYGWLALNYLLGYFDNYHHAIDANNVDLVHDSVGFMDMGGASLQIAFAPNATETARHLDDVVKVRLRSTNGQNQDWNVFVSTWLGFGANEARRRHAQRLVDGSNLNTVKYDYVDDPCLQTGADYSYDLSANTTVSLQGSGAFDQCLKATFPLLKKGLPCKDEPCLFDGVHAPATDFDTDRFVGVSEYWYTANDIFQMGGKYDFVKFSTQVKEYCQTPWKTILARHKNGIYKNIPLEKLQTACFRASWVINVLHEGFGLPSPGLESLNGGNGDDEISSPSLSLQRRSSLEPHEFVHPFQSAQSVHGIELSWTLGRVVLYASSQVPPASSTSSDVGYLLPSAIQSSISGYVLGGELSSSLPGLEIEPEINSQFFLFFLFLAAFIAFFYKYFYRNFSISSRHSPLFSSSKPRFFSLPHPYSSSSFSSSVSSAVSRFINKLRTSNNGDYQAVLEDGRSPIFIDDFTISPRPSGTMTPIETDSGFLFSELKTSPISRVPSRGPSRVPSRTQSRANMHEFSQKLEISSAADDQGVIFRSNSRIFPHSK